MDKHEKCKLITNNFNVNSKWLACKYANKFRDDPNWSARSFIATIQSNILLKFQDDNFIELRQEQGW